MSIPFKQATEVRNNLLVVDALNLAFRFKAASASDFFEEYLDLINSLKRSYKAKYVVVAADKGHSHYRRTLYPEYKANRKAKQDEQTEAEKLEFKQFFADYQVCLEYITQESEYPLLQYENVEADDIAAFIVSLDLPVDHTHLVSSDKDWDLLLSDKVSRFSYVTRKDYTANNWSDRYSFSIEDYISLKCLMGDRKDNVFGVAGIGPKRAEDLVKKYGSALDIVDALPISSNLKFIKELNSCGDLITLNYRLLDLVTFCEDALGEENAKNLKTRLGEYMGCNF